MPIHRPLSLAAIIALYLCSCNDGTIAEETGETSSGDGETTAGMSSQPPTTQPPPDTFPTSSEPPTTLPPPTTTIDPDPTTTTDSTSTSGDTSTTVTTQTTDTGSSDDTGPPLEPWNPLAMELADFDGDGRLDLLLLGLDEEHLVASRMHPGNGDGTFGAFTEGMLAGSSAFPTVGPLDTTPGADVILDADGAPLGVFRWQAGGPFTPWMEVEVINILLNTKIVDADEDGDNDVVCLWGSEAPEKFGLTFLPNSDGNFFFEPVDTQVGLVDVVGIRPNGLLVGDLNGDGDADALLFESSKLNGFVRVFGTPQGAFALPKVITPGVVPWGGELADMDKDGDLDVVLAVLEPPSIAILKNDGAGGLTLASQTSAPNGTKPFTIDVVDLDVDGALDVVAVDDAAPVLVTWPGFGQGELAVPTQAPQAAPAVRVLAGLLDGDDAPDLVLATFADDGEVTVLLSP